jgi:hypothetical protein
MPEVREAHVQQASDPPPAGKSGPAEVLLPVVRDNDQMAERLNDIVVRRIFSAGLSVQSALGRMGSDHPAAGKLRDAVGELDLAIQDIRTALFDDVAAAGHDQHRPPGAAQLPT